jgi:hypothetical protein
MASKAGTQTLQQVFGRLLMHMPWLTIDAGSHAR